MIKKVVFAVLELITIGGGVGLFVTNALMSAYSPYNTDEAGMGAFMVVLGLLIRVWKKELFKSKVQDAENVNVEKRDSAEKVHSKVLAIGLITVFALTFWGFSSRNAISNNYEISSVESEVEDLKNELDMIKKDVDYIGSKSHRHTYSY
jgi:hypothetical protein